MLGKVRKILVTGGCGFIGRNLIRHLCQIGCREIICLDQRSVDFGDSRVVCVLGSYSDAELLARLLDGVDVVIHLGSNALPANNDYLSDVEQNLLGSMTLIKAAEMAGVSRFVYPSSGGTVYGPNAPVPTPEDTQLSPICSYGIIKVAVEHYLRLVSRESAMKIYILRISNPYGPWQNWNAPQGVISVFCHKIMRNEPITLFGNGLNARDFIYIDDLIIAFERVIFDDVVSGTYNIGSGTCHTIRDIIDIIAEQLGVVPVIMSVQGRSCDVKKSYLSIDKARQTLNWAPIISLDEGIRKTIEWQRNNMKAF